MATISRRPGPAALRPPWTATRAAFLALTAVAAAAVAWSWIHLGMSLTVLVDGLQDASDLFGRMLPPRFVDTPAVLELAVQTFFMAYLATCIASVLSAPIAFLAARNTTPHPAVRVVARAVIVVSRAIPDVIFALIFVRAVGIGPLPGVMAMSLHSVGMVGKLYADAIERVDEVPRDAVASTGASALQSLATSVVPQVMPSFVGTSLYRLDVNLRISVILGIVGAGGIGFELQAALRQLVYDRGLGIVCVIAAMVVAVEFTSAAIRRSIIGEDGVTAAGAGRRRREPRAGGIRGRASAAGAWVASRRGARPGRRRPLSPPWTGPRLAGFAYGGLFAALLAGAFLSVEVSPFELVTELPTLIDTVARMFPPDFASGADEMREGMVETLAIGLLATVLGIGLTLPLGLLSARNLAPNRATYLASRTAVVLVRAVPELILAVVFVSAIGLGPVAGVFALAVGTVGFMAKLMADGIEEVDPAPREATVSTGATRLQEPAAAVLPQALPSFVASALYMLDVNIRTSTIVGIVGAGGIGFLLNNSVRTQHLQTTSAIVILLFAVVYAIELLSGWIRKKLL